jgi:hypothetical protein
MAGPLARGRFSGEKQAFFGLFRFAISRGNPLLGKLEALPVGNELLGSH